MKLQGLIKCVGKLGQTVTSKRQLSALLRHHVLAGTEHRPVFAGQFKTIVDIGANRGQFALAAREALPEARIISFEPLDGPAMVYRAVFTGDRHATLHQTAIGSKREHRRMHVAARDDSSSLLPPSTLQTANYPGTNTVASIEVPTLSVT